MGDTWVRSQENLGMKINKKECTGLVIDVQEKLFPHMDQKDELLKKCLILIEGLQVLGIPVLLTEQYPKGLGSTLERIELSLKTFHPIEKISFSCCGEPDFLGALEHLGKPWVVVCGIEAHVCVLQTVIDLVERGYKPVVVADCISSRNAVDLLWSIERMQSEGAIITTCESILFELTNVAGSDEFKAISRLVK